MVESYKPLKKLKGFEHLNEEYTSRKSALAARAAAGMVRPYAEALRALVVVYGRRYRQLKQAAGVLDFEDLQTKAVELLEQRPEVAARYQARFQVVMIDEFQDTDALQLRLVERVAGENLCTVGDEMQSIYGFRGADVEVYRRHRTSMQQEGALVAELATNYRSRPEILSFINAVFGSAEYARNHTLALRAAPDGRGPQRLDGPLEGQPRVDVLFVDGGVQNAGTARAREAAAIAERLSELHACGVEPGDVAVLLRAYTDAHVYADALIARGLPAVIVGGGRFFALPEVAVMRALTRTVANVADEAALGVLLVSDFVPISDEALLGLRLAAEGGRPSLWELICSDTRALEPADTAALERLRSVIDGARGRVGREPLEDVLLRAVEEAGYDLRLLAEGDTGRDAFANVLKFTRRAAEFERRDGSGPAGFSAYLDDKERLGDREAPESAADEGSCAVQIMSIHASKGLEFPVVVVPDIGRGGRANSDVVRTDRSSVALRVALKTPPKDESGKSRPGSEWFNAFDEADKAAQEQERDRVLYVALTRARDLLMVSGSGRLNPAKSSESNSDLARLARVLGYDIPIGGARIEPITLGGEEVGRLRVIDATEEPPAAGPTVAASRDASLPPIGESLRTAEHQTWSPDSVSYTQLSEFERCPRQFRIRRVLGIAPPASPSSQPEPKRLGTALHAALRLVSPEGAMPDEARMDALVRYFELDPAEAKRLVQATRQYCSSDIASRAAKSEVVIHEAPFTVAIGDGLFVLGGSIDLYARSGDSALIVDYKSGASGAPEELSARYRLQAECYALAVLRAGCEHVEVVFVRPEVSSDGQVEHVSFPFGQTDAGRIEAGLVEKYREIVDSDFEPRPGDACANCSVPDGMCEFLRDSARSPRS